VKQSAAVLKPLLVTAALLASSAWIVSEAQGDVFRIAFQGGATTLDPHYKLETLSINWQQYLFDTVTRYGAKGEAKPGLAQVWKSDGANRWSFVLRRGVKFHDGSALTASDVVFSINRVLTDPKSQFKSTIQAVKSVSAPNAYTLEVVTERPDPLLPTHLGGVAVVSEKIVRANPDWAQKPVGSGPYRFVSWLAQDNLTLEANPLYWGGVPTLKRVKLVNVPQPQARLAALLSGQVQLAEKIAPQDVERLNATPGFSVSQTPSTRTIYLALDFRKENSPGVGAGANPFANLKVREAVARAVDRNLIVKSVMGGLATPASQFVAPFVDGFDRRLKPAAYDLEKARKLLGEAGYANGFNLRLDATNDRYLNDALVAQAVGGMLERIGIKTRVNAVSRTVLFPQLDKGEFSAYISGWGSSDLVSTLVSQVMCKNPKEGWGNVNRVGYCNAEVDRLILKAASSFNASERKRLTSAAMNKALLEDFVWIPLHHENAIHGFSDRFAYQARGDEYVYTWEISPR
jgi:peptide/nickel transport system substrate-binding protein